MKRHILIALAATVGWLLLGAVAALAETAAPDPAASGAALVREGGLSESWSADPWSSAGRKGFVLRGRFRFGDCGAASDFAVDAARVAVMAGYEPASVAALLQPVYGYTEIVVNLKKSTARTSGPRDFETAKAIQELYVSKYLGR